MKKIYILFLTSLLTISCSDTSEKTVEQEIPQETTSLDRKASLRVKAYAYNGGYAHVDLKVYYPEGIEQYKDSGYLHIRDYEIRKNVKRIDVSLTNDNNKNVEIEYKLYTLDTIFYQYTGRFNKFVRTDYFK